MSIEARTNRSARDRLTQWEVDQAKVWEQLDSMSFVLGQFAALGLYDAEDGGDDA